MIKALISLRDIDQDRVEKICANLWNGVEFIPVNKKKKFYDSLEATLEILNN